MFDSDGWVLVSHMIEPRSWHAVSTITFNQELEEVCIPATPSPSTTTPRMVAFCDNLCSGAETGSYVGECCLPTYCDCESYGHFQMECTENDTFWCPSLTRCMPNCSDLCHCDVEPIEPTPSESSTITQTSTTMTATTTSSMSSTKYVFCLL